MLQTRNAKRPAQAAVRFAVDAVSEGLLSREQALQTIDPDTLDALLHPTFDPKARLRRCSPPASTPRRARPRARSCSPPPTRSRPPQEGRDVILVRPFTDAEDVAGFHAAKGILTSEGGKASHAALVARGMGRPAVVGAQALTIDLAAKTVERQRHRAARGRRDRDRRHQRQRDRRRRAAGRGAGRRELRAGARLGRRGPAPRRARQRRHPRGRPQGARARRGGDRAVPDRAHVHGRGPPAEDAGDDHGRRHRGPQGGAGRAAAAPAGRTSRGCSRRWPGCR